MANKNSLCLFILMIVITIVTLYHNEEQMQLFTQKKAPISKMLPWWIVQEINCSHYFYDTNIIYTNETELPDKEIIEEIDRIAQLQGNFKTSDVYLGESESCFHYLQRRHFIQTSQSEEEANFPLAYSLLVFIDYPQVELLLRTIYRPEHAICIHVDKKSPRQFQKAMKNLVNCFPTDTVFLAKNPIDVRWGENSLLEAELICMRQLWNLIKKKKWKYFINLTGQEFPLKTNLELVRILSSFNGSNNVAGHVKFSNDNRIPKEKFFLPVQWTKGSVHITATPAFVNFALNSIVAKRLLKLILKSNLWIIDELFFSTLNHNPKFGTPGAYLLEPEVDPDVYPYISRLNNWMFWPYNYTCTTNRIVHELCIWGVSDLSFLISRKELFLNKFHWNFHNLATKCMQEWYWNRTIIQKETGWTDIDLSYYENLNFVKFHQ